MHNTFIESLWGKYRLFNSDSSSALGCASGERVGFGAPSIGLFYLAQSHPFTISWWEDNDIGKATSVSLLLRSRSGFTRKLLDRLGQEREYTVWIDGPFGPASIGPCGFGGQMGDYGHVFMVATGIGIATQLPYIKELLGEYRKARIRTQRISLIWQLDEEGDWESAHDWLQMLVKQDEGCLLNVTVYDTLEPASKGDPQRFGYHDLIKVHSGRPNWELQLSSEVEKQKGRMLVAVSACRPVRDQMLRLAACRGELDEVEMAIISKEVLGGLNYIHNNSASPTNMWIPRTSSSPTPHAAAVGALLVDLKEPGTSGRNPGTLQLARPQDVSDLCNEFIQQSATLSAEALLKVSKPSVLPSAANKISTTFFSSSQELAA
ncbi:NADPH oxidase family protein [Aspergillus tanneri]|uniref:Ferric reductase NAD binding domain-containing protein n=1 Tax=Aspergillus tanneri TaxID=1220188 RepID=A0A5M9MRB0_9EURO|nr:uncharacterized protein ATNIH1004_002322 [Aspergillus tanneri]KAA8649651.1 hypothetical protein ATNIH1004_002322 [Aspergillus tanneri]